MAVTRMRRSSKEVVEYPVVANTPAPLGWPQAFEFSPALGDRCTFRFGGGVNGITAREVEPPGLAQKFGTGTAFLFLDFCHLLRHARRHGDAHGVGGSHGECYLLLPEHHQYSGVGGCVNAEGGYGSTGSTHDGEIGRAHV